MKRVEGAPASTSRPSRAPVAVINLSEHDGLTPVELYFAAFRWEPPAIDPTSLSAAAFLAWLGDVVEGDERAGQSMDEPHKDRGVPND